MKHKNFYENAKEANLRLRSTVVWYDGPGEQGPYFVLIITSQGQADEDFKIYMKRVGQKQNNIPGISCPSDNFSYGEDPGVAKYMDTFMKNYPAYGIIRKDLSSPHFRAFRPFPLGMMNLVRKDKQGKPIDCETLYLERQPNRLTQQGLVKTMIYSLPVNAALSRPPTPMGFNFDLWSEDLYDCIMGNYPSVDTCFSRLRDPKVANEAAAFHRYFALVRGPIGMLFLSYKGDIVGLIDNNNMSSLTVDREFKYTREAISDLHIFNNIKM